MTRLSSLSGMSVSDTKISARAQINPQLTSLRQS